ncbi:multisubunit Na+/H+ antiporter [Geminocystis sp. NIES-3708]|uniref:Na(+)/H(+) antiporter subunit B n=1 Tax=Geminocystis sp. NIES-3708 TaxID=1615909 RepID=UPI0005FC6ACE|nr:Na(+)/H(+) antiporter subunit B [Geminocystis sp. NIES-3708]BAQ60585.1 multisubunit Na+/H+ antiporter [Geminocystis sp. NIES-3708]
MKIIYLIAGIALFIKILIIVNPELDLSQTSIVEIVVNDTGVPNAVSGIIFRNRLYDTIFEVVVFTIAILGVQYLLANEKVSTIVYQFTDEPSIVLARLASTITALVSIELAIRGHLTPGGGFAAGVAAGTAIGLIVITSSIDWMYDLYNHYQAGKWEKIIIIIFILLAGITLAGFELPYGNLGSLLSGGIIPLLNILVALKVALGSWLILLLFIRYRGLL